MRTTSAHRCGAACEAIRRRSSTVIGARSGRQTLIRPRGRPGPARRESVAAIFGDVDVERDEGSRPARPACHRPTEKPRSLERSARLNGGRRSRRCSPERSAWWRRIACGRVVGGDVGHHATANRCAASIVNDLDVACLRASACARCAQQAFNRHATLRADGPPQCCGARRSSACRGHRAASGCMKRTISDVGSGRAAPDGHSGDAMGFGAGTGGVGEADHRATDLPDQPAPRAAWAPACARAQRATWHHHRRRRSPGNVPAKNRPSGRPHREARQRAGIAGRSLDWWSRGC